MGGHVVPMEVAGVGVGVVAHLAAVRVLWWPLVGAETPDADGGGIISRAQAAATIGVEVCQLRLDLLLHLEIHQVLSSTLCLLLIGRLFRLVDSVM